VSEPIRSMIWPHDLSHCPEVACGINEHAYTIVQYLWATLAAGLLPKVYFPRSIERQLDRGDPTVAQEIGRGYGMISRLWHRRLGRRAALGVLLPFVCVIANMPLVMVARKPRWGRAGPRRKPVNLDG
jgi:hypothetical protein